MTVKIVLIKAGVGALLKEPGVKADLRRRADAVAAAAGPGNEVIDASDGVRARAVVVTATAEARAEEAQRRTLTRSIDRARQ